MSKAARPGPAAGLISRARSVVSGRLGQVARTVGVDGDLSRLVSGKMLRTRLAARLAPACADRPSEGDLSRLAAAVELVHSASLCHDDVIDNAFLRRAAPPLWRRTSASGAVLIGDMLLCKAVDLLLETDGGRYVQVFVAKVSELCAAEAEQELKLRGRRLDLETCLRTAREKTGPLFAFMGQVCGGEDEVLSAALEEAGYRVGTAYQLADDLRDAGGTEEAAGKTLGTDMHRGKFTLAETNGDGPRTVRRHVAELCLSALDCLRAWPPVRQGLLTFLTADLAPVFARYGNGLDECLSEVR